MSITLWMPETDPHILAVLGKLGEELNELSARVSRAIVQGVDELDPDTNRFNSEELTREISDVYACLILLRERMGIGHDPSRLESKLSGYRTWHVLIDEELSK
jgi:hypothetical protein